MYEATLRKLVQVGMSKFALGLPRWRVVMVDYETAFQNAFSNLFASLSLDEVTFRGCHFHYAQCIIRNVALCGLKTQYKEPNSDVKSFVKELIALAFVPVALVTGVYERMLRDVPQELHEDENFQRFLVYFEGTWL